MFSFQQLTWTSCEVLQNATQCIALSIAWPFKVGQIISRMSPALPDPSGVLGMICPLMLVFSPRGQGFAYHQNYSKGPLLICMEHIRVSNRMQAQARESVHWPGIDADITDYISWCTICTKHKASPPAQPMLPRDIPDGPWQDIAADYMIHKGHEYLIICNAFSKYPFVYKVTSKSALSLCMHLLELISQYGPPASLSTDNGPPFASNELAEFLMCHCIEHHTSFPHFPRSNGFIKRKVRTIKTALNTALPANKPLASVLLDLKSSPIGPKMPAPCEILHNRTIQWPGKSSQPIDLEQVRNFLISRRQAQCDQFNKSHGVQALSELPPGQEILFRSPAEDEYIPGTRIEKAPVPQSYIIEAQGKRCCRTSEHLWPIHLNLPQVQQQQNPYRQQCFTGPSPQSHKQQCFTGPSQHSHKPQCFPGPSPPKSCIPRPSMGIPSLPRPSVLARPPHPYHSARLTSCIPCPLHVSKAVTVCPGEEDLFLHLFSITLLPSASAKPEETQMPAAPHLALTPPAIPEEEFEAESPSSPDSQASTASYSLCPRLPITYNKAALSWLQGRSQVKICNNLSIPFPSNSECSTDDTDGNQSPYDMVDSDGSPAEVRFITPTDRITDSRDRHGHAYTPTKMSRWPVQGHTGHTRPVLWQTTQLQQGRCPCRTKGVPHREQAFTGPSGPQFRTTLFSLQDHRS